MNLIPLLLVWLMTQHGGHAAAPKWPTQRSPPPPRPVAPKALPRAAPKPATPQQRAKAAVLHRTGVPKLHIP